jgi:molybdenum cofactor cytidylyltransferase
VSVAQAGRLPVAARVAAIILAAGGSQRMGRAKQTMLIDGQPMLLRVADAVLAAGLDEVIVVLGASAGEIMPVLTGRPLTIVVNPLWEEGMASSLRAGLAHVSAVVDAALFVPADMPRLSPALLRTIVAQWRAGGALIAVPTCNGKRGNPVLFARPLFADLLALHGDQGGRALFAGHAHEIALIETGDAGVLFDVDTPDDYSKLQPMPLEGGASAS